MKHFFFAILMFVFIKADAQHTIGQYYYLEHASQNIFSFTFQEPDGNSDPAPLPSTTSISSDDLDVNNSDSSQTIISNTDRNNSYFFNSWNHNKSISIKGKFINIKHVTLKNNSWSKISDNAYHVIEALRADTVSITIINNHLDSTGSGVIEKIASLFVGNTTVLGKVLSAFGSDTSSKSTAKSSIVTIKKNTKDTISFLITDKTIYYAVRYAVIGEPENRMVGWWKWKRIAAPMCSPDPNNLQVNMQSRTIYNLISTNCHFDNMAKMKINFFNDPKANIQRVFIIRESNNKALPGSASAKTNKPDTLFISEPIDFQNEYQGRNYSGMFQFYDTEFASENGGSNRIVVCQYEFSYDPTSKLLNIVGYDDVYYHTQIYYKDIDIKLFPY